MPGPLKCTFKWELSETVLITGQILSEWKLESLLIPLAQDTAQQPLQQSSYADLLGVNKKKEKTHMIITFPGIHPVLLLCVSMVHIEVTLREFQLFSGQL